MTNFDGLNFYKQGWICPKCGNVLSPDTSFCPFCYNKDNRITYGTGTGLRTDKENDNDNRT